MNAGSHWLSYRQLSGSWFLLNSIPNYEFVAAQPVKLSHLFLAAQIKSCRADGIQIFVIRGALPKAQAQAAPKAEELRDSSEWLARDQVATHSALFQVCKERSAARAEQAARTELQRTCAKLDLGAGLHIEWRIKPFANKRRNEDILSRQRYECASCGGRLRSNFLSKRSYLLCAYTGRMHCTDCHRKDRAVIPAQVAYRKSILIALVRFCINIEKCRC